MPNDVDCDVGETLARQTNHTQTANDHDCGDGDRERKRVKCHRCTDKETMYRFWRGKRDGIACKDVPNIDIVVGSGERSLYLLPVPAKTSLITN